MFRPEMLEPMGFPKDIRVHGWGLSLERPTMIRYTTVFNMLCDSTYKNVQVRHQQHSDISWAQSAHRGHRKFTSSNILDLIIYFKCT